MAKEIEPELCLPDARPIVDAFLILFGTTRPSLNQIWAAMDFVWDSIEANNVNPTDEQLGLFYSHPIWLLNGLFVEQHEQSLSYRRQFSSWIASQRPDRVADFGGGYGTLARMVAAQCPDVSVELVDPFPRPEAMAACRPYENLRVAPALEGEYDIVVATDVFEHVKDALALAFEVAQHVKVGGWLLAANHFAPSIKCHLPRTFHFQDSWDVFMRLAGFEVGELVAYGTAYKKVSAAELNANVRRWENISSWSYRLGKRGFGVGRLRRAILREILRRSR